MTGLTFVAHYWPLLLGGYVFMGWLTFGVMLLMGDIPSGSEARQMIRCLGIWWLAWLVELAVQAVALLRGMIEWLVASAGWLFRPQGGKLARDWSELRMLGRHWRARFLGRDPHAVAPPPPPRQPGSYS